ncbi:MAG: HlyD family secretion protein [Rubellimicrobium sp.]|nr:HlyD family secretion protein [Rubellimicrobium sp.]
MTPSASGAAARADDPTPDPAPGPAQLAVVAEAPAAVPEAANAAPPAPKRRRSWKARLLMIVLPLALAGGGGWAWLTGGRYVATDNAYVHQPLVPLSADISGRIVAVAVTENGQVAAGDTLFELDPEPYRIALDRASAAVDQARLAVEGLRAAHGVATAQLAAAESVLEIRQSEYDRQQGLQARGVATPAALDEALLTLRAAENQVALARQQVVQAAAALGGDPDVATDDVPSVRAALAAEAAAVRDLDHATVRAPADGQMAQTGNLNIGQFVAAGSPVASLVETGDTWVEANFKESQLAGLRTGQPVEVSVDAYPGHPLAGRVESFSGATGAQFSLIPAQNATGNWVKVVQRLPVRIGITPDPDLPLRGGMSVTVSVDTGASRMDRLR